MDLKENLLSFKREIITVGINGEDGIPVQELISGSECPLGSSLLTKCQRRQIISVLKFTEPTTMTGLTTVLLMNGAM